MSSTASRSAGRVEDVPHLVTGKGVSAPWYLWVGVAAVTSASIGAAWDVSWHRSIGRDSFWTPAHMAIYACGVLAGIVCLTLVVQSTWGADPDRRACSVRIFGLRAPLGVFLAGWGGLAMLTAAPLDNWWHAAYGLDVTILSLPHAVLVLGLRSISVGMLFLILAEMNRASETGASNFRQLRALFLYLGGLIVVGQMFFLQEYTADVMLHISRPYIRLAIMIPVVLALLWEASRFRWAATVATLVYTIFVVGEILILPLFPAEPKLGPVFNAVTHFVPAKFPILILVPAIALDLLWQRTVRWKAWQIAAVSGIVFTALLIAVEWPFADFLMSPASANRFFGTIYFNYSSHADGLDRMRRFYKPEGLERLTLGMIKTAFAASISAWVGLRFGRWMRGVQR